MNLYNRDDLPRANELVQACCTICEHARSVTADLDEHAFARGALATIRQVLRASLARIVRGERGVWTATANVGDSTSPPVALLADAAVDEVVTHRAPWIVAPVRATEHSVELLVVSTTSADDLIHWASALARLLGSVASILQDSRKNDRRARWMDAIVRLCDVRESAFDAVARLNALARTIAELFGVDVATILLWNRPNRTLVPFCSTGVQSKPGPLPDDVGIVAEVLRTSENRVVSDAGELDTLDRRTWLSDAEDVSVLCVPLSIEGGQPVGALLLAEKAAGAFSSDVEAAVSDFAACVAYQLDVHDHLHLLLGKTVTSSSSVSNDRMIGDSQSIVRLRDSIRRVAPTDLPVLILGENGSGKEVASRMIHAASARHEQPFLAVNCAALSDTLLESELFGHVAGAYTDATENRAGKFELASGGTLFLDEIAELNVNGQAKLLRVIDEQVIVRVGGWEPIATDARVIAATNRDLPRMVREQTFREDLFYRLNVVVLNIPPLRERPEDILLLARHFLTDFCTRAARSQLTLTPAAAEKLSSHDWPGNVRQLRNLMERLAFLSSVDTVDAAELDSLLNIDGPASDDRSLKPLARATREFQADYIYKHIQAARGNMTQAARNLGLQRSNLYRKIRQLGMDDHPEQAPSE